MEIVARTFSERTRGRFFATTQLLSGLSSIAIAALVVRGVLASSRLPFPHNYALLTGIAALMFQVSLVGVLLLREPPPPATPPVPHPPLRLYFRRLPQLLRANPVFARLAVIQLFVGFGAAAAPFYVLYATSHFGLGDQWGGTYQVMQALGRRGADARVGVAERKAGAGRVHTRRCARLPADAASRPDGGQRCRPGCSGWCFC